MSFDERDLRKALDARSGEVTPEFRARLKRSIAEARPPSRWMPAIALATAIAITLTSVGVLVAARQFMESHRTAASGPRVTSPSPTATPGTVQVSAPSSRVVWILVNYDHLYLSTAQGRIQWEERPLPPQVGVRPSISFINDTEGWLLAPGSPVSQCGAQLADIWHTSDGGSTWQDLGARIDKTQCKNGIWFTDANHGFVTAWDPNHRPNVYRTSDGADHWTPSTLTDPPDYKTLPGGFSLQVEWIKAFGNTLYLEAYGTQGAGTPYPEIHDRQYIFTSADGGATWAWKQKVAARTMAMVTESRWLEVMPPNRMDESVNGGQQFHPFDTNLSGDISTGGAQLVFADANVGYATAGSMLQQTVVGGHFWKVLMWPGQQPVIATPPPPDITLPSWAHVSAPSDNVVWVLLAGRYLFQSTDRGTTWQQRWWWPSYQGGGGDPVISFVDDTHGWALFPGIPGTQCLQAGANLYRTTDGATFGWQPVTLVSDQNHDPTGIPFDQCKDYMAFIDSTHGFVAGHDPSHRPIISRTADGGVTWEQAMLPDPPGFVTGAGNSLRVTTMSSFSGALLVAAKNDAGRTYAFRSFDGGATWAYAANAPSGGTTAFVSATRWIQLITPGQSMETADAGASWHSYASDYSQAAPVAPEIVFGDVQVGYATVRGSIQRTLDGGLHWSPIQTPGVKQTG